MEIIQFQQRKADINPVRKVGKFKGRSRSNNNNNNKKFVGVRQRPSGRWVAEIKDTTQKIRMWLGTFESAEEAARAYDEAACLLRGSNTRTNFVTHVSTNSPLAFRIQNLLSSKKGGKQQGANVSTRTSSAGVSGDNFSQHTEIFSDAYKPDLSSCIQEFDSKSSQSDLPWGFGPGFDMFSLLETADDLLEFSEFDRMKVERQISASLYATNGVQEYMETVNDPAEALWDLPPLCSLLC